MKQLIGLLFIVALMSCEKEEDVYCWDCNTETISENYYTSHTYLVCGMTYTERAEFEMANTFDDGFKVITNCKLGE